MTIVAVWQEEDALWAVADTRTTRPMGAGPVITSDMASKLFALPIVCRPVPNEKTGLFPEPYFARAIGFAFAGSLAAALQTFATSTVFLQNLMSVEPHESPSLSDIAAFVARVGEKFSSSLLFATKESDGRFDAAIFGWDDTVNKYRIFHLRPCITATKFRLDVFEFPTTEVLRFGTGSEEFDARLAKFKAREHQWRTVQSRQADHRASANTDRLEAGEH